MVDPTGVISLSTLLGSLAGVLVGHVLGIQRDVAAQERRHDERRSRVAESIRRELEHVRRNLEAWDPTADDAPGVAYPTGAYRSSVASGSFALLEETHQERVSDVYSVVERMEELQGRLEEARLRGDGDLDVERLQIEFGDRVDQLLGDPAEAGEEGAAGHHTLEEAIEALEEVPEPRAAWTARAWRAVRRPLSPHRSRATE